MPIFKTNSDIFVTFGEESFIEDYMNHDKPIYPPTRPWTNERPMQIEDVDLWEVLYEQGGGTGLYISWCPYAEFYMVLNNHSVDTFYGQREFPRLIKHLNQIGIPYNIKNINVDEDMVQF